jgi:hypothetical protein
MKKYLLIVFLLLFILNINAQEETSDIKKFQGTWFEYYQGFGMNCYKIKKNNIVVWYHEGIREKESLQKGEFIINGNTICLMFTKDTTFLGYKNGKLFYVNDKLGYLDVLTKTKKKSYSRMKKQVAKESSQETIHRVMLDHNAPDTVEQENKIPNEQIILTYKKLKKGFYRGSDRNLYIITRGLISPPENYGPEFYKKVHDIDVASYEKYDYYAKDKNHVYIDDGTTDGRFIKELAEVDVSTFQVIWYRWCKDKNHVFYNGKLLKGLRADSLEILCANNTENGYPFKMVKDNDQVFYGTTELKDVDVPSFECHRSGSAITYSDVNWIYKEGYFLNMDETKRVKNKK